MSKNNATIDLGSIDNSCFVVMPFHALFDAEYERVIRPAIESVGLQCIRGNEIYNQPAIIHDIWNSIRTCRAVVAELSTRNPNVMYEIGLAHAIGKPIVLVTRNQDDVPFDLKALRCIFYDTNNPEWGQNLYSELSKKLRAVLETDSLRAHLSGITIQTDLPTTPSVPISVREPEPAVPNLSGVWTTSWNSVLRGRRHDANLVIPQGHGRDFTASMTVAYVRDNQRTVVQETLTGTVRGKNVVLTGVSYTFVEQGSARTYALDTFELTVPDQNAAMKGTAVLKHGKRPVVFNRTADIDKDS